MPPAAATGDAAAQTRLYEFTDSRTARTLRFGGRHEHPCRLEDAAGPTRRRGLGRDRIKALEQDIAFDAETERQPHGDRLGKAEGAELGFAKIGQAEQSAAVRVESRARRRHRGG